MRFSTFGSTPSANTGGNGSNSGGAEETNSVKAERDREFQEMHEKRRRYERQRESIRLPTRESWRYSSDQYVHACVLVPPSLLVSHFHIQ